MSEYSESRLIEVTSKLKAKEALREELIPQAEEALRAKDWNTLTQVSAELLSAESWIEWYSIEIKHFRTNQELEKKQDY